MHEFKLWNEKEKHLTKWQLPVLAERPAQPVRQNDRFGRKYEPMTLTERLKKKEGALATLTEEKEGEVDDYFDGLLASKELQQQRIDKRRELRQKQLEQLKEEREKRRLEEIKEQKMQELKEGKKKPAPKKRAKPQE